MCPQPGKLRRFAATRAHQENGGVSPAVSISFSSEVDTGSREENASK
jgi:hypothetical protein